MKFKLITGIVFILLFLGMVTLAFNIQPVKSDPANIGEWTSDGRIKLCVHYFDTASSLASYPYTPDTAGYIFAWVDLSLKNVGTEEVSTNQLFAYLKDTDNYFYESILTQSPKRWRLIDLPPGEILRGEIYWEVPSEAVIAEILWIDWQSSISVVIPEFSSFLILSLFMIATLLAVIIFRRKQFHMQKNNYSDLMK